MGANQLRRSAGWAWGRACSIRVFPVASLMYTFVRTWAEDRRIFCNKVSKANKWDKSSPSELAVMVKCPDCRGAFPFDFMSRFRDRDEFTHARARHAKFFATCPNCRKELVGEMNDYLFWQI
jgi:hypothetical protein